MEENTLTLFYTIIIGIISGILTTILIRAFLIFFKETVLPWYQIQVYRGVNISGKWQGTQEREERGSFKFILKLNQKAHNLTGTFSSIDEYPDKSTGYHQFSVEGTISDGWVLLAYKENDKSSFGLGSLLLQVRNGGKELNGAIMFLKTKTATIGTDNVLTLKKTVN